MAVLLDSSMSVHHVAVVMATAVEASDLAVRYLNETLGPYQRLAILLAHVTPQLYENCVVLFSVILCISYRICLWLCREESDIE